MIDEQDKKYIQYLVPANVSAKFEFFPGFGWPELVRVIIATMIGVILFFGLGLFKKTILVDIEDLSARDLIELEDELGDNVRYIEKEVTAIPLPVRLLFIIIPSTGTFIASKRDQSTGFSMIYLMNSYRKFNKNQKRYLYIYNSGSEV